MTAADLPETVEGVPAGHRYHVIDGNGGQWLCETTDEFPEPTPIGRVDDILRDAAVAAALAPREEARTGASGCTVSPHIHGCYADDQGDCDDPAEHPPLAPHRADEGALTEDERVALYEGAFGGWRDMYTAPLYAAVERILTTRLAAAGGRDTLAEGETLERVAAWFEEAGKNAESKGLFPEAHYGWRLATGWLRLWANRGTAPLLAASGEGSVGEGEG